MWSLHLRSMDPENRRSTERRGVQWWTGEEPSPGKSNSWVWKQSLCYEEGKGYRYDPLITEAWADDRATVSSNKLACFSLQVRKGVWLLCRAGENGGMSGEHQPPPRSCTPGLGVCLTGVSEKDTAEEKQERRACVNVPSWALGSCSAPSQALLCHPLHRPSCVKGPFFHPRLITMSISKTPSPGLILTASKSCEKSWIEVCCLFQCQRWINLSICW